MAFNCEFHSLVPVHKKVSRWRRTSPWYRTWTWCWEGLLWI